MRDHAQLSPQSIAIPHLETSSHALSLYAEGRLQKQELDKQVHHSWDEHTTSLSVHDDFCVCWKNSMYRKCVNTPCSRSIC